MQNKRQLSARISEVGGISAQIPQWGYHEVNPTVVTIRKNCYTSNFIADVPWHIFKENLFLHYCKLHKHCAHNCAITVAGTHALHCAVHAHVYRQTVAQQM